MSHTLLEWLVAGDPDFRSKQNRQHASWVHSPGVEHLLGHNRGPVRGGRNRPNAKTSDQGFPSVPCRAGKPPHQKATK